MLADFRVLYGVLAAGVVGVLLVQLFRGHSPYDVLGSYSVTGHATYRPDQVVKWLLYHVAELDLYLGIAPFAALLLLTFLGRSLDRPLRVFLAAALPLTVWLLLEVGAFASALSPRIQERNLFYVAPLFLIALLAWIERGMPRPPRAAATAVLLAAALPGALPYQRLIDVSAESDTLALLPLWWLQETVVGVDTIPVVVVAVSAAIGLLFVSISPRYALVLPAVVLLWFAFATERIERFDHGFPKASVGALYQGITAPRRDWVDAAVGRNGRRGVCLLRPGSDAPPGHALGERVLQPQHRTGVRPATAFDGRPAGDPGGAAGRRCAACRRKAGAPCVRPERGERAARRRRHRARQAERGWRSGGPMVSCASAIACKASIPTTRGPGKGSRTHGFAARAARSQRK